MQYTFYMPKTVREALEILVQAEGPLKVLAGGTDLMLDIRNKKYQPKGIVDLSGLEELKQITFDDGVVRIGSMVTFTRLANSSLLKERVTVLAEAASVVGSPQIRNQGTIGGNIANASPAADIVPPLVALGAVVQVESAQVKREVPVPEILAGAGKNNLAPDEIITEIKFLLPDEQSRSSFVKFGRRNALAIARMSVATVITLEENLIKEARIALGAVAPNPFRATGLEEMLAGKSPSKEVLEQVIAASSQVVSEKLGNRPSAKWKNEAIKGLMRQSLQKLKLV